MSTYQTALTQFGTENLPQVLPELRQAAARMLAVHATFREQTRSAVGE